MKCSITGASTQLGKTALKVWRSHIVSGKSAPAGTVIATGAAGIVVACGGGTALGLLELQRAGGKRLAAGAFLAGCPIRPGERLGA